MITRSIPFKVIIDLPKGFTTWPVPNGYWFRTGEEFESSYITLKTITGKRNFESPYVPNEDDMAALWTVVAIDQSGADWLLLVRDGQVPIWWPRELTRVVDRELQESKKPLLLSAAQLIVDIDAELGHACGDEYRQLLVKAGYALRNLRVELGKIIREVG